MSSIVTLTSNITLNCGRPDVWAGESWILNVSAVDSEGKALANKPIHLQRELYPDVWQDMVNPPLITDSVGHTSVSIAPHNTPLFGDLLGNSESLIMSCRACFYEEVDKSVDPWVVREFGSSESRVLRVDRLHVLAEFSEFQFSKSQVLKGEPAVLTLKLVQQGSNIGVSGRPNVTVQRFDGAEWVDVQLVQLNADGSATWTWNDIGDLLPPQSESISVGCKAVFNGYEHRNIVPWISFGAAQASPANIMVYTVPADLGTLVLGVELDAKGYVELPSSKSVHFHMNKPDYYGVNDFYELGGVIVNPDSYMVYCTLTVGDLAFTKSDSRSVGANQIVHLTFSFTMADVKGVSGRERIALVLTANERLVLFGTSISLEGSANLRTKIRSVPLRFVKVKIKEGDNLVATIRTGLEGTFTANYTPTSAGKKQVYAEIAGPLGKFQIASSAKLEIAVII